MDDNEVGMEGTVGEAAVVDSTEGGLDVLVSLFVVIKLTLEEEVVVSAESTVLFKAVVDDDVPDPLEFSRILESLEGFSLSISLQFAITAFPLEVLPLMMPVLHFVRPEFKCFLRGLGLRVREVEVS